jgi:hypothetical protein
VPALALLLASTASAVAWAGPLLVAPEPFATKDTGRLADGEQGKAVTALAGIAGDDAWELNLWAELDWGYGAGPMYVEFFGELDGKRYKVAWQHEFEFSGDQKYVTVEGLRIEGGAGFNRGRTYAIEIHQVNDKGRDLTLARGKIKLDPAPAPTPGASSGGGGEEPAEEELDAQDVADSLAGDDGGQSGDAPTPAPTSAATGAPPPVSDPGDKRGCSVHAGSSRRDGLLGAGLGALLLVFGARRRRR